MTETSISATEANRKFSQLLEGVRGGKRYVVTSHGKPVARLTPVLEEAGPLHEAARDALFARLKSQPAMGMNRNWKRDEMYEDEP